MPPPKPPILAVSPRTRVLSITFAALVAFLLSFVLACGGTSTQATETTPDDTARADDDGGGDDAHGDPHDATAAAATARALGLTATYGDLVSAAQRLDDTGAGDATAACVLRGAGPYRLEGDVAVSIRPLPEAPPDLDARLGAGASASKARVFTRWGQLGADGQIAIAAFTTTPPPRHANGAAFFLTDRGAYLRPVGDARVTPVGPVPMDEAARALQDGELALGVIVVAAEAGIALSTIRALLAGLPADGSVALGVTLAPEVRLPEPTAVADDGRGICADGLPALSGDAGTLDAPAIIGALGPLRDAATRCLANAQGSAAVGGRVSVAFRIGPEGRVTDACAQVDEIGDAALRACILDATRATAFPAPRGGPVDALLPLVLRPDASFAQRPLCD